MICMAFLFLAFLLHPTTEGSPLPTRVRCSCIGSGVDFVPPARIEKIEIFPSSAVCSQLEIIVTLKDTTQRCMNPKSRFTQNIINKAKKQRSSH
ncbi:C-X-C motif chemokine 11-1-like [Erpetoichthys calabaricus]|uniref:Chemokine (C-X-C motif) ligand 11, duplicate 1 n=1 Tax=Erpetoichthys calabaricus TaxID=27687 RepID=A0A8C4XBD0_ERPCA|nr:C-X-C motif chemokine 11-1-like [Erpetoichthys calabaricus]